MLRKCWSYLKARKDNIQFAFWIFTSIVTFLTLVVSVATWIYAKTSLSERVKSAKYLMPKETAVVRPGRDAKFEPKCNPNDLALFVSFGTPTPNEVEPAIVAQTEINDSQGLRNGFIVRVWNKSGGGSPQGTVWIQLECLKL